MPRSHTSKAVIIAIPFALACCSGGSPAHSGNVPNSGIQEDLAPPRQVFVPAPAVQATVAPPAALAIVPSQEPPRMGIAGMAQTADTQGNVRRGRDFAFDNCRPCHVVAPNQQSTTRFSVAPDFQSVANMPSTTPFSLMVWLTNPHPTMPSLVLSPGEASDVIAYIQSLRTIR